LGLAAVDGGSQLLYDLASTLDSTSASRRLIDRALAGEDGGNQLLQDLTDSTPPLALPASHFELGGL
jgi:hypothetical protein